MLSAWLAEQVLKNARIWQRDGLKNGWTQRSTSEFINNATVSLLDLTIVLLNVFIVIICWTHLGSTPTCVPLCIAMPLQQVVLKSGNLPGQCFRIPRLPVKLKNCALHWPAQPKLGCLTGQHTDRLNTVTLYTDN